jgi:hypothetical protein
MTNSLSTSGVETSQTARDGWCCTHPMRRMSFMPLSITLTAICHPTVCIERCTLRTEGGRHWKGETFEDNHMLIDVKSGYQSGEYTASLDIHVQRNTTIKFCCHHESVACVYENSHSIVEHPSDAFNARCCNCRSPADCNQTPHYSPEAPGWVAANTPWGAGSGITAGSPTSHLQIKSQHW